MKLIQWLSAAATALIAILLPGCDAVVLQEIRPGITTADEVRAKLQGSGIDSALVRIQK